MSWLERELRRRLAERRASRKGADFDDFSMRVGYPYMLGVYLAVNAIRDAFCLVEGPDCVHMKTQYVQGNHDWLASLVSVSGKHRIANTALHPEQMAESREQVLSERLDAMAADADVSAVLLTAMPMAAVTAVDHRRLCRGVAERHGKDVVEVPGLSLSGDWLTGYRQALKSIAERISLPKTKKGRKKVAIVGYLFDRNEDDHRTNLEILREMLRLFGLDLVSVWLEGSNWRDLRMVTEAGTIISLPYGREAARVLADRCGAELLELPLPLGIAATDEWLERLAELTGRKDVADRHRHTHLGRLARRMEWLVPFIFQHLDAGFIGDPVQFAGIKELLEFVGARLRFAVITNRPEHARDLENLDGCPPLLVWPTQLELHRFLEGLLLDEEAEPLPGLLVTNNYGMSLAYPGMAAFEFGFPSVFRHCLYPRPFLGYQGALALLDGFANAVRAEEVNRLRYKALLEL